MWINMLSANSAGGHGWHRPVLSQIKSAAELSWFTELFRAPNSESKLVTNQPAADIAKPIVLVVDDDEAVRDSPQNMMESEDFEVRAFSNGHDLLNEESLPATGCLIVDYNMPAMNGLELVGALRGRGVSIPAILITGNPAQYCATVPQQLQYWSSKNHC